MIDLEFQTIILRENLPFYPKFKLHTHKKNCQSPLLKKD